MVPSPMSARSENGGAAGERTEGCRARLQGASSGCDSEALENFAEVVSILREWSEAERRETGSDGANKDSASA